MRKLTRAQQDTLKAKAYKISLYVGIGLFVLTSVGYYYLLGLIEHSLSISAIRDFLFCYLIFGIIPHLAITRLYLIKRGVDFPKPDTTADDGAEQTQKMDEEIYDREMLAYDSRRVRDIITSSHP